MYDVCMSALAHLLEQADAHCGLRQRLELVPAHARSRGVFFRGIELVLGEAGLLQRYRELFPARPSTVLWYPTTQFLEQLVAGAALLTDPTRVREGMFEIGRANARVFTDSLLGRLLVRSLSREPRALLRQGLIGHRQSSNLSSWKLDFPGERTATMDMSDEPLYIDSYLLGAAHGTFEAVDVPVRVEVQMEGPFHGRHILHW
jgi:uncharacterized protein (TIGR02265 family)